MTNLIGLHGTTYEDGKEFGSGEIVAIHPDAIWILMESGFILRCSPCNVKIKAK